MGVFFVFKIVPLVSTRATHHNCNINLDIQTKGGHIADEIVNTVIDAERTFT